MKKIILVLTAVLLLMFLSGCINKIETLKTLDSAGLSNAEATGWKPFSCGQDDWFKTGFEATNVNGKDVTGTVCCGLIFKDCTVRYN